VPIENYRGFSVAVNKAAQKMVGNPALSWGKFPPSLGNLAIFVRQCPKEMSDLSEYGQEPHC
jgi:hypothetical protein